MRVRTITLFALVAAVALSAHAATIEVKDPWNNPNLNDNKEEWNLYQVWNKLYPHLAPSPADSSQDLESRQVELDDVFGSLQDGTRIAIEAVTHWADFDHTIGWYAASQGGGVHRNDLFTIEGPAKGFLADDDPAAGSSSGSWVAAFTYDSSVAGLYDHAVDGDNLIQSQDNDHDGDNQFYTWFSDPSLNDAWWEHGNSGPHDPTQHLVAYQVTAGREYLLGWEDLPAIVYDNEKWVNNPDYDADYQDFMLRMYIGEVIPEPSSMALMGSGLAGLLTTRLLRRRRQRG